ncbi:MAG: HIG1 domain-containing protein [Alphaproteobacteria bacterium]
MSFCFMLTAMILVLASLVGGLFLFGRSSPEASAKGQMLMRLRVLFQGAALLFFLIAVSLG